MVQLVEKQTCSGHRVSLEILASLKTLGSRDTSDCQVEERKFS